ncbi:hypothetical protein OGAPHI_001342 [Ogataea philodendri]|uniref:Peptidase M20 dimerisation domain-containing protein n=1 Tax=Ogataea philodendri TaxID=1378263 RepID=A0A9P8PCE4_9ASCO|nr:uncharacterized protein OGAPHI_001342 [Ogataea philodendri]KAH3669221.1 hypothetical protein OGAPHI_001342 [Ogataea philodendri]
MLSKRFQIQSGKLIETIHSTAKLGAHGVWGSDPTQTGVKRLALSDLDKQIKDWFIQETKALGCSIKVDNVGNVFATYPGKNNSALPTGMGSHLDTQPTGGRYDGIYGVLSGLQVLRTLKENNFVPNYPITLVDWCNEEGARFPMSMMASSVWAGICSKETVYQLKDVYDNKTTVEDELKRIGYLGDIECSHSANPLKCHFEIHIEQGPILESMQRKIGVVDSAQAYTWIEVTFMGVAQHTGTTPMEFRRDALLASSKVILDINKMAKSHGGLATVGKLDLQPAVVNVIPEKVTFVIDIRHSDDVAHQEMEQEVEKILKDAALNTIGNGIPLEVSSRTLYKSPVNKFNKDLVALIESSAKEIVGEDNLHHMVSGAGHDSCCTNRLIPTAMIFVPSKDGISHNPKEYTDPKEIELGFRVLLETILKYDSLRTE